MIDSSRFEKLYFGMASAESEVRTPEGASNFFRTFYDRWNLQAKIEKRSFFLIVGPKGVGKSAINEYIRLYLIDRHGESSVFSKTLNLDEVSFGRSPLSDLSSKLVSSSNTLITEEAWRLFIGLRLFDLLFEDQSCIIGRDPQAIKLRDDLRRAGLASSDYPTVLRRLREGKIVFGIKSIGGEGSTKATDEVQITQLSEALFQLIRTAETPNHFMLSIDGLDRIISQNSYYWLTLAALLKVAEEFHLKLVRSVADVRLYVMCRSDVLRRIRFADADKVVGDATLFVDWSAQQTVVRDSPLWDYLAAKASIRVDKLLSYFPDQITVGMRSGRPRHIPALDYIFQFTRSTPREMSMLMKQIQERVPNSGYVTSDRIRAAADEFASRGLLTIITAESTGILQDQLGDRLGEILSAMPFSQNIGRAELAGAVVSAGLDQSLVDELAEFMFMAGILGNYTPETNYVQFYHRRDTYTFKRNGPWSLHVGLTYAFNIPFTKNRDK